MSKKKENKALQLHSPRKTYDILQSKLRSQGAPQ